MLDRETILEMKDLKISFSDGKEMIQVVRGIDLKVGKGEIIGILGESGSGKTVTATSILGLTKDSDGRVDGGEIDYKGQNLLRLKEKEMCKIRGKEISYIFQDPVGSLNPYKKIGKQIEEAAKIHHVICSKENILKVMKDTGLKNPDFIYHRYPFQLSGGQCQRVVIAMALICQPQIIIADEPTSAIDASLRKKVLSLLKSINNKYDTSMMIITHDFDVARYLCDKIIIMYAGLVMEEGKIQDVLEKPYHPYTDQLLQCVNSLNHRDKLLYSLHGSPPNPYEFSNECPFYHRCERKTESCKVEVLPLLELENGRKTRCIKSLF